VAMEGDEIFKTILEPFIATPVTEGSKKQRLDAKSTIEVSEDKELTDTVIVPLNRYYK
jgi:hypothetical protein